MVDALAGINIPVAGFIDAAKTHGWTVLPSAWAGAIPSSYVTRDAFERIAGAICEDVLEATKTGLDAIYLDLHGAAVAEQAADSEGELLQRLRAIVGPDLPIVASLDLHANVTRRMLRLADALVVLPHLPACRHGRHRRAGRHAAGAAAEGRPARADAVAPAALPDPAQCAEHLAGAGAGALRAAGRARPPPRHGAELLHGLSGVGLRRVRADGLGPWRAGRAGGGAPSSTRRRADPVAAGHPAGARRGGPCAGAGRRRVDAGGHRRHAGQPGRRRRQQHHRHAACADRAGRGAALSGAGGAGPDVRRRRRPRRARGRRRRRTRSGARHRGADLHRPAQRPAAARPLQGARAERRPGAR